MESKQYPNEPPTYDQVLAENYPANSGVNNGQNLPSAPSGPSGSAAPSASYPRQEYFQQHPIATPHTYVAPVAGTVPYYGAMDGSKVTTVPIIPQVTIQPLPGQQAEIVTQQIIVVNGCPVCRIGMLEDDYSCLGIFCAIFFFPLGILACLALRNRRCTNCGVQF